MERVSKAYDHEQAMKRPPVLRAKELEALVKTADGRPFAADPLVVSFGMELGMGQHNRQPCCTAQSCCIAER